MTVSESLDDRFRAAAAAEGLLDVAYDVLDDTPVGTLLVGVTDHGVCRISFDPDPERELEELARMHGSRVLRSARPVDRLRRELDEYFAGRRRHFDLEPDIRVVPEFNRRVLEHLARVDYGETTTYGALAKRVRQPARGARRRHGDEPEPGADRPAVPPRDRRERQARRLRRRPRPQGAAAPARGRDPVAVAQVPESARADSGTREDPEAGRMRGRADPGLDRKVLLLRLEGAIL